MKTLFTFFCFILGINAVSGQFIESFKIEPAEPTATDSVYFIDFVTDGANFHLQNVAIDGDTSILIRACYVYGDLTIIEHRSDTFNLGCLGIGEYNIIYLANQRHYSYDTLPPCQPDLSTDTALISFTVYPAVGINEAAEMGFSFSPNPVNDIMHLSSNSIESNSYEIYSLTGAVLASGKTDSTNYTDIDVSALMPGTYFIRILNAKKTLVKKFCKI